jgi:adenine-specific DNA-methyltransferase
MGERSFDNPKDVNDIGRLLSYFDKSGWVVDYFSGSGTTGASVINSKRDGRGDLKYLLVEMGAYFDEVLKPRLIKTSYAKIWKAGSPVKDKLGSFNSVSHCFKYLRLESYDDTLNNLELDDNPQRNALMEEIPELRHDYTLKYMLDVETRGSASLLNTEWFRDPEGYKLKIKQPDSDESRETSIDLVETFNWLIGLHVSHLDKPRTYVARFERETDPELPEDQNTRLKAVSLRENDDGAYWIRQVEGHVRRIPGSDEDLAKVLVVWRKLTDDPEKDAAVLEALLAKYKIGTTDSEFDSIYINGPHGLNLTGNARSRVHSLEETFHDRMWEGCDDEL